MFAKKIMTYIKGIANNVDERANTITSNNGNSTTINIKTFDLEAQTFTYASTNSTQISNGDTITIAKTLSNKVIAIYNHTNRSCYGVKPVISWIAFFLPAILIVLFLNAAFPYTISDLFKFLKDFHPVLPFLAMAASLIYMLYLLWLAILATMVKTRIIR